MPVPPYGRLGGRKNLSSETGSGRTTAMQNGISVLPRSEGPLPEQAPFMLALAVNGRLSPIASDSACWGNGKNGLEADCCIAERTFGFGACRMSVAGAKAHQARGRSACRLSALFIDGANRPLRIFRFRRRDGSFGYGRPAVGGPLARPDRTCASPPARPIVPETLKAPSGPLRRARSGRSIPVRAETFRHPGSAHSDCHADRYCHPGRRTRRLWAGPPRPT